MRRNKKKDMILIAVILFLFLGIGYAIISASLTFDGTTNFRANTWSVYLDEDSFEEIDGSVEGDVNITDDQLSLDVHFTEPGDYYAFTIDIVNDGTIDAMIESIDEDMSYTSSTLPFFLNMSGGYISGASIDEKQLLSANTTETIQFAVRYLDAEKLDPNYLPSEDQTVTITITLNYSQADSTAEEIRSEMYRYSTDVLADGDVMPFYFEEDLNWFPMKPMDEHGVDFAIKHIVDGSKILSTSFVFREQFSTYELFPGEYEENVDVLSSVFSLSQECEILEGDPSLGESEEQYRCTRDGSGTTIAVTKEGAIGAIKYNSDGLKLCSAGPDSETGVIKSQCVEYYS